MNASRRRGRPYPARRMLASSARRRLQLVCSEAHLQQPCGPRPPSSSVAQRADSLRAVEVTSRDDGQSGSSPPVESKRYNRDPSPSRQPPSLTSSQPVKSADGPSRPVNENKPSAGLRVVQSKYRETQPSAFEPEEGKRVGRGCVPRHSSSFLALHRPV